MLKNSKKVNFTTFLNSTQEVDQLNMQSAVFCIKKLLYILWFVHFGLKNVGIYNFESH